MGRRRKPVAREKVQEVPLGANTLLLGGVAAVVLVGLGALLYLSLREPGAIQGLIEYSGLSRGHDNDLVIEADELPPAGGVHHDRWQNCGIYTEPVAEENAVHSLEHGAVWITYQPDLPERQVNALQNMVRGQTFLLLSPYPGQRSPIVLTAWSVQLEVDSPADNRVEQFINRYRLGPTTPERGAACTGGVGEPIS